MDSHILINLIIHRMLNSLQLRLSRKYSALFIITYITFVERAKHKNFHISFDGTKILLCIFLILKPNKVHVKNFSKGKEISKVKYEIFMVQ